MAQGKKLIELPVLGKEGIPNSELPIPRDDEWYAQPKRPKWLRVKLRTNEEFSKIKSMMSGLKLNTVCQEARCPNIYECWSEGTATFMIMGDTCTRACGFCAVKTGRPEQLDTLEPKHVAEAAQTMDLEHVVITSVNRDELEDGGAQHFADTIVAVREANPKTKIEVLIPDFRGNWNALETLLEAKPDVLNHNTETVPRLYKRVRNRASYEQTLTLLQKSKDFARKNYPSMFTKSGIMLGLGESWDEIIQTITDIRNHETDILTVGQYMRPSFKHLPVQKYYTPAEFDEIKEIALELGYRFVESGPLVRSSYHAGRHREGAEKA